MLPTRRTATQSIFIGLVIDRARGVDLERLIRSIAVQRGIEGSRLGLGLKANDGRDYEALARAALQTARSPIQFEIRQIDKRSFDNVGAGHNLLAGLALEQGFDRYVGLKPDGLLHHDALRHLTEKWLACDERSLVEMRVFPKEHPKIYDPATGETTRCSDTCFSIAPEFLKSVGGFDMGLGPYFHDVDLSWRVRLSGQACYIAPRSLYFHDLTGEMAAYSDRLGLLKSGRYLAWKWKNEIFQSEMEDQLLALGAGRRKADLERLPDCQVKYSADEIASVCDFAHGFDFAFARW